MKKNYIVLLLLFVVSFSISLNAQQVPNPGFEDWSGAKYDVIFFHKLCCLLILRCWVFLCLRFL